MSEVSIFIGIYLFAAAVGLLLAIMLLRRATADDEIEDPWRDM